MSEEKRAAVVKRGTERDRRDLFASRPTDLGSVKTLRPPVDFGGVAARNETSVLFTVDSLRSAADVSAARRGDVAPEAPLSSGYVGSDDEGVIDLKALASTPPAKIGAFPRSVAPLFNEPPPGAFAADVESGGYGVGVASMSRAGRFTLTQRTIAGVAAGLVAVALCTLGLAAAFKGEEPVVHAANAVMAPVSPVSPAAPVVVAPSAPEVSPITPTPANAASEREEPKAVSSKRHHKGKAKFKGAKRSSFAKVQSSGVAATSHAPRASKAADKCRCKGDFNCILRCSAKGK